MRVLIFEDEFCGRLHPLAVLRPVYDIITGAMSVKSRLLINFEKKTEVALHCRNILAPLVKSENKKLKVNDIENDDYIFLNGRVSFPVRFLEQLVKKIKPNDAIKSDDNLIAAKVKKDDIKKFKKIIESKSEVNTLSLKDFRDFNYKSPDDIKPEPGIEIYDYPWDVFKNFYKNLLNDLLYLECNKRNLKNIPKCTNVIEKKSVCISTNASVHPYSEFDGSSGMIIIDEGATIEPFVYIKGPVYIGKNCVVKAGTKISGPTFIGDGSKVSGEISECIFHFCVNKQHDGFIGNTYACPFVNFGADTVTSNLKNNYSKVRVKFNGEQINTGMQFLGSIVGDHTKFGINTMLNTGTICGIFANVAGGGFPDKQINSFEWNIIGSEITKYKIEEALSTAHIVMGRRHIEMSKEYESLVREVYNKK
jgi:UDP-N-acetylglucosamine diphosphorylase / glucose-1-phosphate thymidylyltransferase / UDP-N-acetylgalactosamine diphosphorylase / glucosamine-1-phosphate N-acetyltransferase / galactosamine-1-phosphate N-acetyltransferase